MLRDGRNVCCVVPSRCSFIPLLCLFVLVDFCFFCDLTRQGLWTEAHQCDQAPQWQLPSAAGPWPVPRCLRRWSSLSAYCFLCTPESLNTAAIQWTDPQFFGCSPRPSRPSVCVHGPQLYSEIAVPFLFSAVGLLRLPPCDSQPLHSLRLCAHSGKSAFKQMKKKKNHKWRGKKCVFVRTVCSTMSLEMHS